MVYLVGDVCSREREGLGGDGMHREIVEAIAEGVEFSLFVAEVTKQDVVVGETGELLYRTRIQLSFKYKPE